MGRGAVAGTYAAVARAQPIGLVAMRQRGIHYWWAGLGVLVLVVMYAAPIAGAFRQPKAYAPVAPLPQLSVPAAAFPLLRVPKVHKLAPLPPLRHSVASPSSHAAASP